MWPFPCFHRRNGKGEAASVGGDVNPIELEKRVDHPPEQMSGGEQQRVAIAEGVNQ